NTFIPSLSDTSSNGLIELSSSTEGITRYNSNNGTISISGNEVRGNKRPFALIRPQSGPVSRFSFTGNRGINIAQRLLTADNARGGILSQPLIADNIAYMSGSTTQAFAIQHAIDPTISNN